MSKKDYCKVNNKKGVLHYKVINESAEMSPLIFLHDALGSIEQWKGFPKELCKLTGKKGIIIDRYGHGQSGGEKKIPLSISFLEDEADDLRKILSLIDIKDPILVGSSDGGTISLIYAAKYWAKAIITIAGHYFNEKATSAGVEKMKKEDIKTSIIGRLEKYHGEKAIDLVEAWQEIWTSERFQSWDISSMLPSITCDSLVLQGTDDPYATDEHAISLSQRIGDHSNTYIIEGAGHFPHLDSEKRVIERIIAFLNDIEIS